MRRAVLAALALIFEKKVMILEELRDAGIIHLQGKFVLSIVE